jgi:hypothetical protein
MRSGAVGSFSWMLGPPHVEVTRVQRKHRVAVLSGAVHLAFDPGLLHAATVPTGERMVCAGGHREVVRVITRRRSRERHRTGREKSAAPVLLEGALGGPLGAEDVRVPGIERQDG